MNEKISVRQAAAQLSLSVGQVRKYIKTGKLKAIQPGGKNGKYLIPQTEVNKMLEVTQRG